MDGRSHTCRRDKGERKEAEECYKRKHPFIARSYPIRKHSSWQRANYSFATRISRICQRENGRARSRVEFPTNYRGRMALWRSFGERRLAAKGRGGSPSFILSQRDDESDDEDQTDAPRLKRGDERKKYRGWRQGKSKADCMHVAVRSRIWACNENLSRGASPLPAHRHGRRASLDKSNF